MAKAPVTGALPNMVTLKVTLRDTKPPIWRRLVMPAAMTLRDLHGAIQAAIGWHNSHLHMFIIDGDEYGDPRAADDVADEARVTLTKLLRTASGKFSYVYDFGDAWDHDVVIEKTGPAAAGAARPVCIAGRRRCPPEDCGGAWGYADLLAILADPAHPDHAKQLEYHSGDLDPAAFDLANANAMLATWFKPSR